MEERLLRELQKSNPWWLGRREALPEYRRKIFPAVLKYIKTKQILALIGLRRVGKTILLKQLIGELLHSENPKNILFFSFEEKWGGAENVEDMLYYFLENSETPGRKYIFLDEIQKADGWEDVLKRFYDRQDSLKFVVSGSASISISKSIESLAGRIFDFYITPLSFFEFLEMNEVKIDSAGSGAITYKDISALYRKNLHQKERIEKLFDEYLFKGGFPEIARETDDEIVRKYLLNSLIDRILLKDLPEEFKIKKTAALRELLEYAARESSGIFAIENIASLLKLDKGTVSEYIEYLKRSFLIYVAYNYTGSIAKQIRTSKKIHIVLPSVAIAIESYGREILLYPNAIGKYVESLVAVFSAYKYRKIFFWRTPRKEEVDVVYKTAKGIFGIEVKYQSQINDADAKSLLKFCERFKTKRGILVTKNLLDSRQINGIELLFVPAWLFFLGEDIEN